MDNLPLSERIERYKTKLIPLTVKLADETEEEHRLAKVEKLTTRIKNLEKLEEIEQDLQSAISYAGGCNLGALNLSKVSHGVRL